MKRIYMVVKYKSSNKNGGQSYEENYGFYWDPHDWTVRGLNELDWDGELEGHCGSRFIMYTRALLKLEFVAIKKTNMLDIVVETGGRFYIVGQEKHIEVTEIVEVHDYTAKETDGRVEWLYSGTATSAKKSVGLCGTFEVVVGFEQELKKILMDVQYKSTHARGPKSYNRSFQLDWGVEDGKIAGLNGLDWHGELTGGIGGNFVIRDRMNLLIELKGI